MKKLSLIVPGIVGGLCLFQASQFWTAARSVLHQNLAIYLMLLGAIFIMGGLIASAIYTLAETVEVISKDEIQGGE